MHKFSLVSALIMSIAITASAVAAPKYGPNASPLSRRTNQQYFKTQNAPDFWALVPFYIPQSKSSQCSTANFAMVLNSARKDMPLTSDDQNVTIKNLLAKYTDERYAKAMSGEYNKETFDRSNVANARLTEVLGIAVDKLGIKKPGTKVELIPATDAKAFHNALVANEKSADDFMILIFIQGTLTGDPEGGAHVATVGAYDAKKRLVLIMDPDREWYEPYWAPEAKVFEAVSDPKSDSVTPGWIHFKTK